MILYYNVSYFLLARYKDFNIYNFVTAFKMHAILNVTVCIFIATTKIVYNVKP